MKTILKLLVIFCFGFLQACAQERPAQMSPEYWAEDIDYLNDKIEDEFATFNPEVKEQFGARADSLKSRLPELTNPEVACEIQRILASLQDGHTELNIGQIPVGFHRVPLSLYFFENELHVLAAHEEQQDLLGAKVKGIENWTITDAFQRLKMNMSRDNDMEYLHAGPGYIVLTELLECLGISDNPAEVTFTFGLTDGSTVVRTFQGLDPTEYSNGTWVTVHEKNGIERPLYLNREGRYWYKYLPESKIMYFHFARVNNEKGRPSIKKFIRDMFREIDELKPEKLVIDFRFNSGGNYNRSRPLIDAIKEREWLDQKGKVWAITGRRTFSAASAACIFLKQETNAQLIGEAGRTHPNLADNNEYMTLPNSGYLIEYTTIVKEHWPERPDLDRIPVDVEIPVTFENYSKGVDAVMEYLMQ